jgi:hypothetical protein
MWPWIKYEKEKRFRISKKWWWELTLEKVNYVFEGLGLWHLTPLSTIFQLYHGSQCFWWRNPVYRRKLPTFNKSEKRFRISKIINNKYVRLMLIWMHNIWKHTDRWAVSRIFWISRYSQNREIVMANKFKDLGVIKPKSLNRISKICERQLNDPCVFKYYARWTLIWIYFICIHTNRWTTSRIFWLSCYPGFLSPKHFEISCLSISREPDECYICLSMKVLSISL